MAVVIVAPHPDDEWVGCGCTLLKNLADGESVKVLKITRMPYSENRLVTSKDFARKYGYKFFQLNEPEYNISEQRLVNFLKKHVLPDDVVFCTSFDKHPDHRRVASIARRTLLNKNFFEYATYNNAVNPFRRLKNKVVHFLTKYAPSSFRHGSPDLVLKFHVEEKGRNIVEFGEVPRGGDVIRRVSRN
jgi:LmbE family N-acetylglucosaminyl deacetylase